MNHPRQTHLVNRVLLQVEVAEESFALQLRKKIADTLEKQLGKSIEKICDQLVAPTEWLKIDKIEINLGNIPPEEIAEKWFSHFEVQFKDTLQKKLATLPLAQKQAQKAQSDWDTFIFYIEKGYLPWWEQNPNFDLDTLVMELIDKQSENLKIALKGILKNTQSFKRLIYQLKVSTLLAFVVEWGLNREDAEAWLLPLLIKAKIGTHSALTQPLKISKGMEQVLTRLNEAQLLELLSYYFEELLDGQSIKQDTFTSEEKFIHQWEQILASPKPKSPKTAIQSFQDLPKAELLSEEQHLYIQQAGLVLLAPFLPAFFKATDLLDEQSQFKSAEAQCYAVFLLHFLATGSTTTAPEYALLLEKLLCGMSFEEALPAEIELLEIHQKEALLLLEAVIGHWQALKSSSPRELREAFLKRFGSLEAKGLGEWLIRVERQTWDLLLEKIPWGFSLIKLPWTTHLIHIVW